MPYHVLFEPSTATFIKIQSQFYLIQYNTNKKSDT